ncbi:mannose-6-phosphate receptor binding protein 1 [Polypterus senegalus]|uniref:mannose-6-phosphate receptor binding protein 1 n=1 Tax=Polypterus senegalus TaxID=55291 RepID=UPI00196440B3|nr:mannose-6-phosphate receptor binding protein 1 [Polypterus senegalus]
MADKQVEPTNGQNERDLQAEETLSTDSSGERQSLVSRVTNLPLISSAYDMVASTYSSTKENHPYIKSVCDVAEMGVKTLSAAAASGSKPLLDKFEPQIATANDYACKGLDHLEQKLPILKEPTEKVVADTKQLVSGARDSVTRTVYGAKDTVTSTVTGVVDMAKGAVQGGVEMTKSAVGGGVNTVMGTRMGQLVVSGVDMALGKSEEWVDYYLPMTEEELAQLSTPAEGSEVVQVAPGAGQPSYYVRLGVLSKKLQTRALQHSLGKAGQARQNMQQALVDLHSTIDLIELTKKGVDSASQKLSETQENLHQKWQAWSGRQASPPEDGAPKNEPLESRILTMARGLSGQLQSACLGVVSSAQGLPQHVQEQLAQARQAAAQVHGAFNSATSFSDLSTPVLAQSRQQLAHVRQSLDGVVEYLKHNTPLNWLVGPFAPQITEKPEQAQ